MNLLNDIRYALLPECILTVLIILSAIFVIFFRDKNKIIHHISSIGAVIALISFAYIPIFGDNQALWESFASNSFTVLFRIMIITGAIATFQLGQRYIANKSEHTGEFYLLIQIATLGAMLLAGSNDLIMVFVALETLSISCFALTGLLKCDKSSNEASLKYLVVGAASSAILLYGFSFIYGFTGETQLDEIAKYINSNSLNIVLMAGFLFTVGGFSYKIAAVPFQVWAPDVYQGAPYSVAAFLSVVSKAAGFAVLIRVLSLFHNVIPAWELTLSIIAVLTMTIGNIAAIGQSNIKRFMAYSSIAQAGYILLGLAIATKAGIAGIIFYLIAYLLTNFGTWAAIGIHINNTGEDSIESFSGLAYRKPLLAGGLTICLLSLAGIPLTAGFISKFYLFQAVIMSGFNNIWLLFAALINTIIAVYYYLRVIRAMFTINNQQEGVLLMTQSSSIKAVLAFTGFMVIFIGIIASPFISLAELGARNINLPDITTPYSKEFKFISK